MSVEVYTKEYFLTDCEGFDRFLATKGQALSPRLKRVLSLANIKPDSTILDIGCGRGDLTLHAGVKGSFALGVDFSKNAIELARESLKTWSQKNAALNNKVYFVEADCLQLEFRPQTFDFVFLSDVIEHLKKEDFEMLIARVSRFLKKDGKIILHTSPNRIFKNYGLKLYNIVARLSKIKYNWHMEQYLPRGLQKEFHVNEQTIFTLKKIFREQGFALIKLWLEKNPHYIYHFFKDDKYVNRINRLYDLMPIKHLFFSDIYGIVGK